MLNQRKAINVFIKYKALFILAFLFIFFAVSLPSPLFITPTSSLIEDCNGELLGARIAADGQWRFPECKKVPNKFAQAIIAFEDKRFYAHTGVDGIAIGRALIQNIKKNVLVKGAAPLPCR